MPSADDYPVGAILTFADVNHEDAEGVARGPVNGPALTNDDGEVIAVPVFAARSASTEATTVYVNINNILGIE